LPLSFLSDTGAGDSAALGDMVEFVADYQAAFEANEQWAFSRVVDLWGGKGTFDAIPDKVRNAMVSATGVNIRQWKDNLAFTPTLDEFRALSVPAALVVGQLAHPTSRLMSQRLSELLPNSSVVEIENAGHFMVHSHAAECARISAG
jgi:pimeloyl-ACP methyl ester carboxylesterase